MYNKNHDTSTDLPTRKRRERNSPCTQRKIRENRSINKLCWVYNATPYYRFKNKYRGASAMLHDTKDVVKPFPTPIHYKRDGGIQSYKWHQSQGVIGSILGSIIVREALLGKQ